MRPAAVALLLLLSTSLLAGAERHWQTGTWTKVDVSRQIVDFGPGSSTFNPSRQSPPMRAMADIRVYVIETEHQRLELREVVQIGRQSVEAVVGEQVTFALEKSTVFVRDADGTEHKLRMTKKTTK